MYLQPLTTLQRRIIFWSWFCKVISIENTLEVFRKPWSLKRRPCKYPSYRPRSRPSAIQVGFSLWDNFLLKIYKFTLLLSEPQFFATVRKYAPTYTNLNNPNNQIIIKINRKMCQIKKQKWEDNKEEICIIQKYLRGQKGKYLQQWRMLKEN